MIKWLRKLFVPHEHNGYHPHFLRHASISFFLLLVIIIEVGFFIQIFYVFDKTKFLAAVLPGVITEITNEERADAGLAPLTENALLTAAAQLKAEDMAAKGYFAHTSPEGLTPWHWFGQVGYKYTHAGENLAVNFFESADVAEAWMNSPTHKANIVKANYTEIGVGVASGTFEGKRTVFVAQLFGTPISLAPVAVAPTPTSAGEEGALVSEPNVPTPEPELIEPERPALEPETTVVLGEETAPKPAEIEQAPVKVAQSGEIIILDEPFEENVEDNFVPAHKTTPLKTTVEKALVSPRHMMNYAYGAIALLAAIAVALAFVVKTELRHPGMVARGAGLIAVIVALSIINLQIAGITPKVPGSNSAPDMSANAASALE